MVCMDDLSDEIVVEILSYLTNPSDFAGLSRMNWRLHNCTTPHLYREAVLDIRKAGHIAGFSKGLARGYGRHLRKLVFLDSRVFTPDGAGGDSRSPDWNRANREWKYTAYTAELAMRTVFGLLPVHVLEYFAYASWVPVGSAILAFLFQAILQARRHTQFGYWHGDQFLR
ncbi:hypothetical protein K402DRAFT_6769 [Aulographum hederae CBS 113979]|uniref:F-box domain-containing protein n=1 Tax=Aulographum hederae CBS 113979 TaxID=1176131 RepID=A0A6G1HHF7_9PEZI|nr:hypothetical protein K402DRAFT_6769 [Aulographum hederae CBS 113979]